MTSRRHFLTGLLASGLIPAPSWADLGNPAYLSAARLPSGAHALIGLDSAGAELFRIPLPDRGHAAAAHPQLPVAVGFARRPGTFAMVLDCRSGRLLSTLSAPAGHHFYGHGVYSSDGQILFTTENDFENARGMIGLWDAADRYRRIGAIPSGGIGPHDLLLMPDGQTLVVANGGIETHPETGRTKLNLPTMQPNLSYLTLDGSLLEQVAPPPGQHKTSIRHLAIAPDGRVALACQWQGEAAEPPALLATHRRGAALSFHSTGFERAMMGYAGSVAYSPSGAEIALTGPRGGMAVITSAAGALLRTVTAPDICGVAPGPQGFLFTTGTGRILHEGAAEPATPMTRACEWDNHLVALPHAS